LARFVSKYANYSHGVRSEIVEQIAPGQTRVLVVPLEAKFESSGHNLSDQEVEVGQAKLSFTGLPEDRDTESLVHPRSRMSCFDSEQAKKQNRWSQEDHDLVVETLRESEMLGVEFVELEQPARLAPWKGYDKLESAKKIVELVEAIEINPAEVLAYELENAARADVIAALEGLLGAESSEEAEVVIEA
jgi:hypothetical protein